MVSIILINYNGIDDTCELIDSLKAHETYPYEVIVVDNASKDGQGAKLQALHPEVKVICSSENLGFARGNNLGIEAAQGEYIFILNNDTIIERPILLPLIERLESDETIGCACPKLGSWPEREILQYAGATPMSAITLRNHFIGFRERDVHQYDVACETAFAHGAAFMIRKKDTEVYGLMPTCYFLYYEELDWCVQMQRHGFNIWYEPAAVVYHKESASVGMGSTLSTYYHTRNRFIFACRTLPLLNRWASYCYQILVSTPKKLLECIVRHQTKHIIPALRGLRDGICAIASGSYRLPAKAPQIKH